MHSSVQKKNVLSIVKSSHDHPTADIIYQRVREKMPNISLGTVYRNLKKLVEDSSIQMLETTDKSVHYDGDASDHIHFVCTDCGKIIDIYENIPVPEKLKQTGAVAESQKVVFYGKCRDCK